MDYNCIVITGASSGIGLELAKKLSPRAREVILVNRTFPADLPLNATKFRADLTLGSDLDNLIHFLQTKPVDLLINNAGCGLYGPCLSTPPVDQLKMIELNITALTRLTLATAQRMQANQRGIILNISSIAAFFPFPEFAIYAATKAYVNYFSLALHEELRPFGIQVLLSCPGQVSSNFRYRASQGTYTDFSGHVMTPSYAADQIIAQIQSGKRLVCFDRYYRLGAFLFKLLPINLRMRILQRSIQKRVKK